MNGVGGISLLDRALRLHAAGDLAKAEQLYRAVLAADKRNAMALAMLGTISAQREEFEAAVQLLDRSLKLDPRQPFALNSKGVALRELERYDGALAAFGAVLKLEPQNFQAYCNRANTYRDLRRYDEALADYGRAASLNPGFADAHYNWALALQDLKRDGDAIAHFSQALALNPANAEGCYGRGKSLLALKRYSEAAEDFARTLSVNPSHRYALGFWIEAKRSACDWKGLDEAEEKIAIGVDSGAVVPDPFSLLFYTDRTAFQRKAVEAFVRETFPRPRAPLWRGERYRHDRIRVAYVSADYREHATSYLAAGLFEEHDRSRFEITGISLNPSDGSEIRSRIENGFDRFVDVNRMRDSEIAQLIRKSEIDIVIDLKGFTEGMRAGIFAYRPAPVQVNYLGYPGTMAVEWMDYLLADRVAVPPEVQRHYRERIVHLPHTYQCTDRKRAVGGVPPTRADAGLPDTAFVFASFNNTNKIGPGIFKLWMRLLSEVPGSVLWLLGDNAAAIANLRREAERSGIATERLVFAPRVPQEAHLARHRLADLFLDTLPYGAHTTASDALWMGLPVLTSLGGSFAGRVAASLLTAAGLPELIAPTLEEYEAVALRLARDPVLLGAIRNKLAENRLSAPLFDTVRFARGIEAAFEIMHRRAQSGAPPESFAVEES